MRIGEVRRKTLWFQTLKNYWAFRAEKIFKDIELRKIFWCLRLKTISNNLKLGNFIKILDLQKFLGISDMQKLLRIIGLIISVNSKFGKIYRNLKLGKTFKCSWIRRVYWWCWSVKYFWRYHEHRKNNRVQNLKKIFILTDLGELLIEYFEVENFLVILIEKFFFHSKLIVDFELGNSEVPYFKIFKLFEIEINLQGSQTWKIWFLFHSLICCW